MTFPEFIAAEATWWDRLQCWLVGHTFIHRKPTDLWTGAFCWRCGREP